MDLLIIVHIKSSYDGWKAVFDSNPAGRQEFADDSRTPVSYTHLTLPTIYSV